MPLSIGQICRILRVCTHLGPFVSEFLAESEYGRVSTHFQQQLICIFKTASKLLILDEAISHLDVENERLIQQALDELGGQITMVVIAHRLTTVRNADQIVVLEAGRVVESGDWETLQSDRQGRLYSLSRAHVQPLE